MTLGTFKVIPIIPTLFKAFEKNIKPSETDAAL
jgi:hypothetical protein